MKAVIAPANVSHCHTFHVNVLITIASSKLTRLHIDMTMPPA